MRTNFGLQYNKNYFEYIVFDKNAKCKMQNKKATEKLTNFRLDENNSPKILMDLQSFELKTTYPGLLVGSGYSHAIGGKEIKDEMQLGYYFDHTTGLPVIPGSSIKGVLRYACEMMKKDKKGNTYLERIFKRLEIEISDFNQKKFVDTVFGKSEQDDTGNSIYKRDIFFDAYPIKSEKNLFKTDYITPHNDPLKDPVPIQFLRVQPSVLYKFQFDLKDYNDQLTAEKKLEIFKEIIKDLGLGAKTNVGYGQFVETTPKDEKMYASIKNEKYKDYKPSNKAIDRKKGEEVEMEVIGVGEYISFKDEVGSIFMKPKGKIVEKIEKKLKANPSLSIKEFSVGDKIKIKFNRDFSGKDINSRPNIQIILNFNKS